MGHVARMEGRKMHIKLYSEVLGVDERHERGG